MVLNLADAERETLLVELQAERFGAVVPWWEARSPGPKPRPSRDTPRTCALRRRLLCEAIDGHYRDDRPAPTGRAA